jgi:O-antigen/teichoic acid export membrane protein
MADPAQTYAAAAAKGGAWATLQSVANKVATIGATYVVARQLSPEQYGAGNVALALSTAFVVLAPTSMSDVLVAHQSRFAALAGQARRIMGFVGGAMLLLALLMIPAANAMYAQYPAWTLGCLLAVTAFRPLLDALGVVAQADLRCRLEYRRIALVDGTVQFGATMLTVALALGGAGSLSIILPQVVAAGVKAFLFRRAAGPPAHGARPDAARELWRGFVTMALGQYVHNVLVSLEILVLGMVATEAESGIFSFAFVLAVQANAIIGFQVGGVLQPIFGRLAQEPERQLASYLRVMRALGMGIVAISCLQAALAPSLFRLVFDAKWEPSIAVFMVLSVGQAFYFGTAPTMALLKAQRRFGAYLAWQASQLAVSAAAFAWSARAGGAVGVAWASAATWAIGVMAAAMVASGSGRQRVSVAASFVRPWLIAGPVALGAWWAAAQLDRFGNVGRAAAVLVLGPASLLLMVAILPVMAPGVWADAQPAIRAVARRLPRGMVPGHWRGDA